jgi:hypothetical protein
MQDQLIQARRNADHCIERRGSAAPLFSVCIPQFNRTAHLLAVIASFVAQSETRFEFCIVDDCSTDDGSVEIIAALHQSERDFIWLQDGQKRHYDRALRKAMQLARGRYWLPFGNDDAWCDSTALAQVARMLAAHNWPAVAVCNFIENEQIVRRVQRTGIVASGVAGAVSQFRQFGFVSGVVLRRDAALLEQSTEIDDSKMLQMYLACRWLASGGTMLGIEQSLVRKDIAVNGQAGERFYNAEKLPSWPIRTMVMNPAKLATVVYLAIHRDCVASQASQASYQVLCQLYQQTYPYWVMQYRQTQSWGYAAGVALGFAPYHTIRQLPISGWQRSKLWLQYLFSMAMALSVPVSWFKRIKPALHRLVKRRQAKY